MLKAWSLKLHRWITLIFAMPLLMVIITGLILSVEPYMLATSASKGELTREKLTQIQKEFDADRKARSFAFRSYTGEVTLGGVGEDGETLVTMNDMEEKDTETAIYGFFSTSKNWHQRLIGDLGELVHASTIAMLVMIVLGLFMGLPKLRNTLGGWHKCLAWGLLPLIILSPLSGILLGNRVNYNTGGVAASGKAVPLWDAVEKVAGVYPPSSIIWVRPQGGGISARVIDKGEFKVIRVTDTGLYETPKNWVRLVHEGTWSAGLGSFLNLLVSIVFVFLAGSGLWIWARRYVKRWRRKAV